jgi:hypothetical protein
VFAFKVCCPNKKGRGSFAFCWTEKEKESLKKRRKLKKRRRGGLLSLCFFLLLLLLFFISATEGELAEKRKTEEEEKRMQREKEECCPLMGCSTFMHKRTAWIILGRIDQGLGVDQRGQQEESKGGIYTWAARLDPWPRITLEQQVWLNTAWATRLSFKKIRYL